MVELEEFEFKVYDACMNLFVHDEKNVQNNINNVFHASPDCDVHAPFYVSSMLYKPMLVGRSCVMVRNTYGYL